MTLFEPRISQLVRWNAKKGRVYVRTIAMDPSGEARDRVGRIFGTLAVEGSPKAGDSLTAFVEDALAQGLVEALRRLPGGASQEAVFQFAVARVNHTLSRLLDADGAAVSPEKVCGAVVSQRGLDVVAACWGQPSILLFHPSVGRKTLVIDLLADSEAEEPAHAVPQASRGFTGIVAGSMGKSDRLVVATRDLRLVFGEEKLGAIITANDPEAATAVLRDTLSPMGDAVALAVLVADAVTAADAAKAKVIRPALPTEGSGTTRSIEKLLDTETTTKEVMAPALVPSLLRRIGSGLLSGFRGARSLAAKAAASEPPMPNIRTEASVEVGHAMEWTDASPKPSFPRLRAAAALAAKAAAGIILLVPSLLIKKRRAEMAADIDRGVDTFLNAVVGWFNGLTPKSRALFLAVLGLTFVLNQSLLVIGWQRHREEAAAAYERSLAGVQQKIDSSEASLIYNDESRARSMLEEAATAIAALPEKNDEQKRNKDLLGRKVADAAEALRKAVALPPPDVIATIVAGEETTLRRMAFGPGGELWTATGSGEVFRIGADGASEKVSDAAAGTPAIFLSQPSGVIVGGSSLTMVAKSGKSSPRPIDWNGVESSIEDAEMHASRLYVLDASHNRILRLPATSTGFAAPQHYLKDGTDVSSAVSLAIDGSVYVLSKDGRISKIEKGSRQQFDVQAADPPVASAARLRTDADSESLYVLEPAGRRILRFSKKNGALAAQYVDDALADAADLLVDEKNAALYAAAGNRVLRFTLPPVK